MSSNGPWPLSPEAQLWNYSQPAKEQLLLSSNALVVNRLGVGQEDGRSVHRLRVFAHRIPSPVMKAYGSPSVGNLTASCK